MDVRIKAISHSSGVGGGAPDDKVILHSMDYAQELLRGMRTFQDLAISSSIIRILQMFDPGL